MVGKHRNDQGRGYGSKVEAHQCWSTICGPFMNNITNDQLVDEGVTEAYYLETHDPG
jgi:hypothetical protein